MSLSPPAGEHQPGQAAGHSLGCFATYIHTPYEGLGQSSGQRQTARSQEKVTMSDSSTYLVEYQKALAAQGIDPAPLVQEAEALELLSGADLKLALDSFRTSADQILSIWDSDYGAILLEVLGDKCKETERKIIFYEAASTRAAIFTSWATAGAEGLARKIDLDRINEKLAALRTGR